MTAANWFRGFSWAALLYGVAWTSAPAAAQCTDDADCDAGFTCQSFGTVDCGFACPEGETCPDMPPDCMPMELKECASAPCTTDADCPDDMTCWAQPYYDCPPAAEPDCPPDSDCPKPEPVECTETTMSTCVADWVPPCTEDADCGPGFKCVEILVGMCSGSEGSAGGAAGAGGEEPAAPPEPTEPQCTETPSGEFYCELQETPCTDASECPEGFTCEANPNGVVCSAPALPSDVAGSGGSADAGAGEPVEDPCAPAMQEPDMVCLPPYWNQGFGGAARGEETSLESGAPAGGIDDGATATGAPGAAPTPAMDPTAMGEGETASMESTGDGGGLCAVGAAGSTRDGAGALWAMLGLGLLALRRRRAA